MPKGTEVHVGFFWPQSKQICWREKQRLAFRSGSSGIVGRVGTYLVGWLRLELLKELERLLLCRETAHLVGWSPVIVRSMYVCRLARVRDVSLVLDCLSFSC